MADDPALRRGGGWLNSVGGGGARRGRTRPSRTSRRSLPSSPAAPPAVAGSRRATDRPRSMISTGEPLFRPSIKALRLFFLR
jgi:hypothetical protein